MAKILVADHDRDYRELVVFSLRFAGHIIYSTDNAQECLDLARRQKPDLLLVEFWLVENEGIDFCARLKPGQDLAEIHVVYLTEPGEAVKIETRSDPCGVQVLSKSLSPDELTRAINKTLKGLLKAKDKMLA